MSALLPFDSKTIAFSSGHFIETSLIKSKSILTGGLIALMISACGSGGSDQEDPLVVDEPVAYVKRPIATDDNGVIISENVLEPDAYQAGAALYIKSRGSQSAEEVNITDRAFGAGEVYDVKDLDVSFDGSKLVFSMRGPIDPDEDDDDNQPKWRLWEYDTSSDTLQRLFDLDDDISGDYHDIDPVYLSDGSIVFSSTRQLRSRDLLANQGIVRHTSTVSGEDEYAFNLHLFNPSNNDPIGDTIEQITFNHGHDLQPSVLSDGRILFLRNETAERSNDDRLSLYTINPNGSNLRLLYGFNSQNTGIAGDRLTTFIDAREAADGSLVAILKTRESQLLGGDAIRINAQGFIDIDQPTNDNRGDTSEGQTSIASGPLDLTVQEPISGYFNSIFPIAGGGSNFLVSWWGLCQLENPTTEEILPCTEENLGNSELVDSDPLYGLWNYNFSNNTQVMVTRPEEGMIFTDAVWMDTRTLTPLATTGRDSELAGRGVAALHIHSVYDTDGTDTSAAGIGVLADPALTTASQRPARFLRIVKATSIPTEDVYDFDNSAFGLNQNRGMRKILGYAPIEPDGSVKTEVPADAPFYFDIVNAAGERIAPQHRNFMHMAAGETYQCIGCHTDDSDLPHGRIDAEAPSINTGAAATGTHFLNTVFADIEDAESGDTMAEIYAKAPNAENANGARPLSPNLIYTDDWTDADIRTPDVDSQLSYSTGFTTTLPVTSACLDNWISTCQATINYNDHIQPLWETTRGANTCTDCHSINDNAGNPQQPAGQLELTSQASTDEINHYTSYRELLRQDTPLILNPAGSPAFLNLFVLDIVNGAQQFYLDSDGDQILDAGGNPIPEVSPFREGVDDIEDIYVQSFTGAVGDVYLDAMGAPILDAGGNTINVMIPIDPNDIPASPVMLPSNASGSRFFDKLEGSDGTVDHSSFMSANELRLLREWLDIGGQYYNNPFDAPLAD